VKKERINVGERKMYPDQGGGWEDLGRKRLVVYGLNERLGNGYRSLSCSDTGKGRGSCWLSESSRASLGGRGGMMQAGGRVSSGGKEGREPVQPRKGKGEKVPIDYMIGTFFRKEVRGEAKRGGCCS